MHVAHGLYHDLFKCNCFKRFYYKIIPSRKLSFSSYRDTRTTTNQLTYLNLTYGCKRDEAVVKGIKVIPSLVFRKCCSSSSHHNRGEDRNEANEVCFRNFCVLHAYTTLHVLQYKCNKRVQPFSDALEDNKS